MRNSIAAGRRLAARIVFAQAGVSLLVAAAFLAQGWRPATGACAGGALVMLGNAVLAARMFSLHSPGAALAFTRFIAGTALKWLVVLGGLYLLLGRWQLPPVPVLAGFVAALLVNLMALRFQGLNSEEQTEST